LPFDNSVQIDPGSLAAPGAQKKSDQILSIEVLEKKPALLWGTVGGIAVVIAMVVFVLSRNRKTRAELEAREALPSADTQTALPPAKGAASAAVPATAGEGPRLPALMPSRAEVLLGQLQENSRANPEAWANVLRGWLNEEETH